ncbi:hypothetical protein Tco_1558670, partial [Tanacetum coccineum]
MVSFRLLHSHLKALSNNDLKGTCINGGFERAFTVLFDQDVQTFTCSMLLNLDQLEQQLVKEEFQETGSMDAFRVLKTQFQTFINFRYYFDDFEESQFWKEQSINERKTEGFGNDTHTDDADINSVNDKQPMAEVDRNTTSESTDMSHRGGEIDQNADAKKCQVSCPLPVPSFDNMTTEFLNQFLESENISLKKTVAQL